MLAKVIAIARSKVEIIGPSPNETPTISAKEMNTLLNESYASLTKVEPKEGKKDIKMEVDKLSPNGEMGLNFN